MTRRSNLGSLRAPASSRQVHLPTLGQMPFTHLQKRVLDARAGQSANLASFINPEISLFDPPADNQPFVVSSTPFVSYPDVGANPAILLTYRVRNGLMAVIQKIAIIHQGGNPPDGTGQVIWRLLKNGAGIHGMNAMTAELGTFSAPNDGFSIVGVENDVIQVTVELPAVLPDGTANAPMPVGTRTAARFQGWTYPLGQATHTNGGNRK